MITRIEDNNIDALLKAWAEWYRTCVMPKSKFSTTFMFTLLKTMVFSPPVPCYKPFSSLTPAPQIMENLLRQLYRERPLIAVIVRLHYLDQNNMPHNAQKLSLSLARFKRYLQLGRQWLKRNYLK